MKLDSRKKSRQDRMMCSNSFDMQEMREIGQKEAGESKIEERGTLIGAKDWRERER